MGYRRRRSDDPTRARAVRRVLWVVLALNLGVASLKVAYGLITSSISMQADGFHSLFDAVSNVVALVGLGLAARPADRGHPYGHAKYETYASAVIGAILAVTAWQVGSSAWGKLVGDAQSARVDALSFGVIFTTLAVNIAVTLWERREARRLRSTVLAADSLHTASDAVVSVGVIAGLVAVRSGAEWADPVVALGVAAVIAWTAFTVLRQAEETLSDRSRLDEEAVRLAVLAVEGVQGCHSIRTRGASTDVLVDLHVQVAPSLTVEDGHRIAERAERALVDSFECVADVIVHLEPYDEYQRGKTEMEVRGADD